MMRSIAFVLALAIAAALAASCIFVVDQRDSAVLFSMGRIEEVVDAPGLHLKWPAPFENVLYVDMLPRNLDSTGTASFSTAGDPELKLGWSLRWRVRDPARFVQRFGDVQGRAGDRLQAVVRAALAGQVATLRLPQLIGTPGDKAAQAACKALAVSLAASGIEPLDLQLTRVSYAPGAAQAVYARMGTQQRNAAVTLRTKLQAEADTIRAEADKQQADILAAAYRKSQSVMGDGDARAAQAYAASFGQDPKFAAFFRSLQAYRASFAKRGDVMVFDTSSEFFRYMRSPDGEPARGKH